MGEQNRVLLASLEVGKNDQASVDLFVRVSDNVTFSLEGKGEVHVSGYFEPDDEDLDEAAGEKEFQALYNKKLAAEADDDEDDESDEDEKEVVRKASKASKTSQSSKD